jgi:hypothetical protein
MSLQARGYTLPITLINAIANPSKPRSHIVAEAIHNAHSHAHVIVQALERRLRLNQPDTGPTSRVTVSVTQKTVKELAELTAMTELGTEHVLRLALEEYLVSRS